LIVGAATRDHMTEVVLTITQVAERLGISRRTIRIYESEGFITVERQGNRTLLRPPDIEAILRIERIRNDLGVNLAGVGVILEMRRKLIEMQQQLDRMEREFDRKLQESLSDKALAALGRRAVVKVEPED
jgi:MerR family transcriptional regulator, heat shock protein HspR